MGRERECKVNCIGIQVKVHWVTLLNMYLKFESDDMISYNMYILSVYAYYQNVNVI